MNLFVPSVLGIAVLIISKVLLGLLHIPFNFVKQLITFLWDMSLYQLGLTFLRASILKLLLFINKREASVA